ncbi:hypothetical protein HN695_08150 [Candidatus Woesearchaeota archaeon]|jgi:DNA-directed RNA polymerase subunit F|nr:hypothetical protein [Candidatus Woesearchaeota archaeon]MBT5272101.1 hypothetical protein [Candidatus Woesearchaeota archaeon]MBT6041851.1 hypothetical protein [Candidatus Woesearchaeota archaeon]MBT6336168.1 hypothetical protein [Candidatus Woesearchaeota archaeon]MBT7928277.1 hypothetical protein [Candidatus Woesearchaeota archaeon]
MATPEVLDEKPISMGDLKEELEKNRKKFGELNFRAERTNEYLEHLVKIKPKESKELVKKLHDLKIPRLRETHIFKIADLLPHKLELVKLLFQGTPLTISDDNCKKIVKVVEEFLPEKKEKEE